MASALSGDDRNELDALRARLDLLEDKAGVKRADVVEVPPTDAQLRERYLAEVQATADKPLVPVVERYTVPPTAGTDPLSTASREPVDYSRPLGERVINDAPPRPA